MAKWFEINHKIRQDPVTASIMNVLQTDLTLLTTGIRQCYDQHEPLMNDIYQSIMKVNGNEITNDTNSERI